jgi:hypothetical protein
VQDKLIKYPPAITKALTNDVNRYINASEQATMFVRKVIADGSIKEPLWIGFVENPKAISELAKQDVTGYTVLIPAEAPRHIDNSHAFDGGQQRPAEPEDFEQLQSLVNSPDDIRRGNDGRPPQNLTRLIIEKMIEGELFRAVFEVRPGKANRSLALVSLVIKTKK